ncbi:MAG TPA: NAD(P)/FAD-dependent oxidoreductase [Xanthobacteraceae bacterium]|nr:NAD(P)/FAD-dependent oxidoreductase [Xanthobacteraceae bacterium]
MAQRRPQVVIIGAGFGGLEAAKALRRAPVEITVLDAHNHHCFQPLLYQVATAALSPAEVAWPIRHILRSDRNATVLMATVTGIDTAGRRVLTAAAGAVPYDFLILATGATHSYFGHDEWAPVAPGLKRIEDALHIRRELLIAFEQAEVASDPAERRRLLTFVIVGGGPTGVEMAGAIAEIARHTLVKDFRRIDPSTARIILLEAGPQILPAMPEDLSDYAKRTLMRMGVEVMTSTRVTKCDAGGVDLERGRIDSRTLIWAAGVVASPAALWLNAAHDRAGRVIVEKDLSVTGHPEIFAIGDTAAAQDGKGRPVPGIAPAAKQMGRYAGKLVAARIAGTSMPAFRYRHMGDLATIGRRAAIVSFHGVKLRGFIAWLFWGVAHIYFLIGLKNRFIVAFTWFWDFITFNRGARLITEFSKTAASPPAPAAERPPGA